MGRLFCIRVGLMLVTYVAAQQQELTCVVCSEASSNHECNLKGTIQTCPSKEESCFTEIRKHGGVYYIKKGCMQTMSCAVQAKQNFVRSKAKKRSIYTERCNDGVENSICHFCCQHDWCNLAEAPTLNKRSQSCIQFFPVCRASWFSARNGFLPNHGSFLSCHCDNLCQAFNDCCHDYQEICIGVLPTSLRSLDINGGATGGEYDIILPRGGGLPLLRCFVCKDTSSNKECNKKGKIEECPPNQRSCLTEIRTRDGRMLISKRCEQQQACQALHQSAPTCGKNQVCFSCCDLNYCNVFERPHEKNFAASCLTSFPGYPQCKRDSLSFCTFVSGNTGRCSSTKCNCDKDCAHYVDCCDDYEELCETQETPNMRWIFREIDRNQVRMNIREETFDRREILQFPSQRIARNVFPAFTILEDFPTTIVATPALIRAMKRDTEERISLLFKKRKKRRDNRVTSYVTNDNYVVKNL